MERWKWTRRVDICSWDMRSIDIVWWHWHSRDIPAHQSGNITASPTQDGLESAIERSFSSRSAWSIENLDALWVPLETPSKACLADELFSEMTENRRSLSSIGVHDLLSNIPDPLRVSEAENLYYYGILDCLLLHTQFMAAALPPSNTFTLCRLCSFLLSFLSIFGLVQLWNRVYLHTRSVHGFKHLYVILHDPTG